MPLPLLVQAQPTCTRCALHAGCAHPGVPSRHLPESRPPDGDPASVLVVVGMNPGAEEDRVNMPFVGRSGQVLLRSYLQGSGLLSSVVYLCNIARCASPGGRPTSGQYQICVGDTMSDIRSIMEFHEKWETPRAVLAVGADPSYHLVRSLSGSRSGPTQKEAFASQGTRHVLGAPFSLFHTYHPANVLRSPSNIKAVEDHLQVVRAYMTGRTLSASLPRVSPLRLPPSRA